MRINTDYDETVHVERDERGDITLSIAHGIQATEATLRPTQAERLAEEIFRLTGAGLDALPPDAVRPSLTATPTETPNG